MSSNKIITSLIILSAFPFLATAEDDRPVSKKDYYFATVKVGLDQAVTHGGNANIDNVDTTYNAGVEFGKKISEIYGLSLEYKKVGNSDFTINDVPPSNARNLVASWSGKSDVFMLNGSVDVIKNSLITPYVKFGMGASVNRSSDYVITETASRDGMLVGKEVYVGTTNTKFAWQIGMGLNVTSNELFDVDMAYMFMDRGRLATCKGYAGTGVFSSDSNSAARTTNLRDHTVTLGLKTKF